MNAINATTIKSQILKTGKDPKMAQMAMLKHASVLKTLLINSKNADNLAKKPLNQSKLSK